MCCEQKINWKCGIDKYEYMVHVHVVVKYSIVSIGTVEPPLIFFASTMVEGDVSMNVHHRL